MMTTTQCNPHQMPLGCSLLIWISVFVFTIGMIVVMSPSVMRGIAVAIHCPGAVETIHTERDGGSIRRNGRDVSTTTTTILCVFPDGSEKTIGNDPMFFTGFGVAIASGTAFGVIVALIRRITRRSRRSPDLKLDYTKL